MHEICPIVGVYSFDQQYQKSERKVLFFLCGRGVIYLFVDYYFLKETGERGGRVAMIERVDKINIMVQIISLPYLSEFSHSFFFLA